MTTKKYEGKKYTSHDLIPKQTISNNNDTRVVPQIVLDLEKEAKKRSINSPTHSPSSFYR